MTSFPGQKVVCIESFSPAHLRKFPGFYLPTKNSIYQVRERCIVGGEVGLKFRGIVNPLGPDGDEPCYLASAFRPLTERKNDADTFIEKLKEHCLRQRQERERVRELEGRVG